MPANNESAGAHSEGTRNEAVRPDQSSVPPRPLPWRKIVGVGAVVALAVTLGSNYYISRHRDLYIVNGFQQPITVTVPGRGSVKVAPGALSLLTLPEGRHRAGVRGAVEQTLDFEMPGDFFGRWFDKPVHVLNPGGAAILLWEETTSSSRSKPDAPQPFRFYFGDPYLFLPAVDFPFQEFPSSLKTKGGDSKKSRVGLMKTEPEPLFFGFVQQANYLEALRLAEWDLRLRPANNPLLNAYVAVAKQQMRVPQARTFLQQGLSRRPVEMPWHRAYQEMFAEEREVTNLVAEYDALLQAEPTNSALLYLRGRLGDDDRGNAGYFEQALARDPRNAYALNALGFHAAARGDWATAREKMARAAELQPDELGFAEYLFEARLALGEAAALEQELRAQLARRPFDVRLTHHLCDALLAQQKQGEARQFVADFEREAKARFRERAEGTIEDVRRHWLYSAGDFAELEKAGARDPSPAGFATLFEALVESGKLSEAAKVFPRLGLGSESAWHGLALSLAWHQAGSGAQAAQWRAEAAAQLAGGRKEWRRTAAILRSPEPTPLAGLLDLPLTARDKAIVVAAQAQRFPAQRAELLPYARRFNVERGFPYHLIQRVCDEAK